MVVYRSLLAFVKCSFIKKVTAEDVVQVNTMA